VFQSTQDASALRAAVVSALPASHCSDSPLASSSLVATTAKRSLRSSFARPKVAPDSAANTAAAIAEVRPSRNKRNTLPTAAGLNHDETTRQAIANALADLPKEWLASFPRRLHATATVMDRLAPSVMRWSGDGKSIVFSRASAGGVIDLTGPMLTSTST
jgi:hypothetical protein